jgi:hypothetical protein
MGFIWKEGDWAIHQNKVMSGAFRHCLRHMCCGKGGSSSSDGGCACGEGKCYFCKTKAPEEIIGFFKLVKWER